MAKAALGQVVGQEFPIAVVGAGHGAGAHDPLEVIVRHLGHISHRLLQCLLDLGQRRNRHPQRQFLVQHMIFAHVGVGQHIVPQALAVAQPCAVAQHHPGMRAQHGNVVGDGFGIGRADANVHHGDAAAVGAHQVVGRHLRQTRRRGAQAIDGLWCQTRAAGHHVAGLDKSDVLAVCLGHFGVAQANELVDIKLVVGEQHIVLEPLGCRAGVVAQAVQRVVNARCGKQRQGQRATGLWVPGAIGNAVIHGGQVWQVKDLAHHLAAFRAQAAFNVVVVCERKVNRNGLCAQSHFKLHIVVALQQAELGEQVVRKKVGAGDGGFVKARMVQKTIGQTGVRPAYGVGLKTQQWVTSAHGVGKVLAFHVRLHGRA